MQHIYKCHVLINPRFAWVHADEDVQWKAKRVALSCYPTSTPLMVLYEWALLMFGDVWCRNVNVRGSERVAFDASCTRAPKSRRHCASPNSLWSLALQWICICCLKCSRGPGTINICVHQIIGFSCTSYCVWCALLLDLYKLLNLPVHVSLQSWICMVF